MKNKIITLVSCMGILLSACSDSDKNKPVQKVEAYVPDPAQIYQKAVSDMPANMPTLPQDTEPCFLDVLNNQNAVGVNVLTDKSKAHLSGWAGDVPNGKSPQEIWLEFDGIKQDTGLYYIKATPGAKRQDVADFFKKPGLVDTGWKVFADLTELTGGIYEVHVVMQVEQHWLTCDTKRVIQI